MWVRPGIGEDSDEVRGQPSAGADVVVLGADVGWGESSPGAGARSGDLVKSWRMWAKQGRGGEKTGRVGAGWGGALIRNDKDDDVVGHLLAALHEHLTSPGPLDDIQSPH